MPTLAFSMLLAGVLTGLAMMFLPKSELSGARVLVICGGLLLALSPVFLSALS